MARTGRALGCLLVTIAGALSVAPLALAGTALVASGGSDTVEVYDVADPRRPVEVGSFASPGEPDAVAVAGGEAYVADYVGDTLQIFDFNALLG